MNSYEINPRPTGLGGGWRLRLLEAGEEVGGGVFPLSEYVTAENAEEAASYAHEDALAEASAWLASRSAESSANGPKQIGVALGGLDASLARMKATFGPNIAAPFRMTGP